MEMQNILALQSVNQDDEPLPDCCCSTASTAGCVCTKGS